MTEVIDANTHTNPVPPVRQEPLPGAGGILTMGILSIVFAGLIGMILAIIALSTSKRPMDMYKLEPERYTESSYKQIKSGRVCAIIGLSLLGLVLLIVILAAAANA